MDTKVVPAYIEQMHERGKLSDDEYRLIALAMKIKACRLRSDTVESSKDKCSVRFEITFVKDMLASKEH